MANAIACDGLHRRKFELQRQQQLIICHYLQIEKLVCPSHFASDLVR